MLLPTGNNNRSTFTTVTDFFLPNQNFETAEDVNLKRKMRLFITTALGGSLSCFIFALLTRLLLDEFNVLIIPSILFGIAFFINIYFLKKSIFSFNLSRTLGYVEAHILIISFAALSGGIFAATISAFIILPLLVMVFTNRFKVISLLIIQLCIERDSSHTDNAIQRCTDFMAHIG